MTHDFLIQLLIIRPSMDVILTSTSCLKITTEMVAMTHHRMFIMKPEWGVLIVMEVTISMEAESGILPMRAS